MTPTLYTQQSKNVARTWLLMAVFLVVILGIGYFLGYYYNNPAILYFAVIFSLVMNITSYWYSDKIALSISGAKEAKHDEYTDLYHIVENLSITAGLPMPKIYVILDPSPNAFATGRNKEHAVVAVTTGLLETLNKVELEGVISHELSHIGNRDILLSTIVVVLVGFISILANMFMRGGMRGGRDRDNGGGILMIIGIVFIVLSPIFSRLIQLAISRKREFLADASGALLTRYPEGLASALQKISDAHMPMKNPNPATAHLFISNPFGKKVSSLFSTHPPVEERIKALIGMSVK
ncbi:MAG: M48 family metalloprotease [Candidatus Paceibacterota bacterium]|jgi:heat shock protein HtpX